MNFFKKLINKLFKVETVVNNYNVINESFVIVEGLTINDIFGKLSYQVEENVYQKLLDVWSKKLIPVLKVNYNDYANKSVIYLPCSKQRWLLNANRRYKSTPIEAFITKEFICSSINASSRVVVDANNNLVFINNKISENKDAVRIVEGVDSSSDDSSESDSDTLKPAPVE